MFTSIIMFSDISIIVFKKIFFFNFKKEAFSKDLELTKGNLNKRALQTRISQAKAYYERLHISPLMVGNQKIFFLILKI